MDAAAAAIVTRDVASLRHYIERTALVVDLSALCRAAGLSRSGLKATLQHRLLAALQGEIDVGPASTDAWLTHIAVNCSQAWSVLPHRRVVPPPPPSAAAPPHPVIILAPPAPSRAPAPAAAPPAAPSVPTSPPALPAEHAGPCAHPSPPLRSLTCTWGGDACPCGVAWPHAPVVRCIAPSCGVAYHCACVGVMAPPPAWRCPVCRAAAMMPDVITTGVLDKPRALKHFPAATVTLSWMKSVEATGKQVRLVCLPADAAADVLCLWPGEGDLRVNGMRLALPKLAKDARSAAILDLTSLQRSGLNSTSLKLPSTHPYATSLSYLVALEVRPAGGVPPLVEHIVRTRMPPRSLLYDFYDMMFGLARRPGGRYLGETRACLATAVHAYSAASISQAGAAWRGKASLPAHRVTTVVDVGVDGLDFSVRDVATLLGIRIPVRGQRCCHLQCFDLEAYLTMNARPSARWRCPVCRQLTMPFELWIDPCMIDVMHSVTSGLATGGIARMWDGPPHVSVAARQADYVGFSARVDALRVPDAALRAGLSLSDKLEWSINGGDVTAALVRGQAGSDAVLVDDDDEDEDADVPSRVLPVPLAPTAAAATGAVADVTPHAGQKRRAEAALAVNVAGSAGSAREIPLAWHPTTPPRSADNVVDLTED